MSNLNLFQQVKASELKSGISIVYLLNDKIVNDYIDEVKEVDDKINVWVNDYSRKIVYEPSDMVRVDGCPRVN